MQKKFLIIVCLLVFNFDGNFSQVANSSWDFINHFICIQLKSKFILKF